MNQNEINGAEFSGAAASNILARAASAVARAIVSGTSNVYRTISTTIASTSVVSSVLRNQYNGLLALAAIIVEQTGVEGRAFRVRLTRAVASTSSTIYAVLNKIYSTKAVVQGSAVLILANLVNQFNGIVTFATNVIVPTSILAKVTLLKLLKTVVSSGGVVVTAFGLGLKYVYSVIESAAVEVEGTLRNQFNGLLDLAAEIVNETQIIAKLTALKRMKAVISSSSVVLAFLRALVGVKAIVGANTLVQGVLRDQFNGLFLFTATIVNRANIIAKLTALKRMKAVVSSAANIVSALLKALVGVKAVVQVTNTLVQGILRNQFNGFRLAASQVVHNTVVVGKAVGVLKTKTILAAVTVISARLYRVRKIKAFVSQSTVVSSIARAIRRGLAVLRASTVQVGKLSVRGLTAAIAQYVTFVVGKASANRAAATSIVTTTAITADLIIAQNEAASPENTFIVPPDDVQYDVEE